MGKSGGGGSSHTPYIQADTVHSVADAFVVDALGEGPMELWDDPAYPEKDILLNDTPIQNPDGSYNFQRVEVHWRAGYPDQSYIPGFPIASSDITGSLGLPAELKAVQPVTMTITASDANAIRVRFALDALYESKTNGDCVGSTFKLKMEMRDSTPGSNWAQVYERTITDKISSKYEWDTVIDLAKVGGVAPWYVRVTRITPDSALQTLQNASSVAGCSVLYDKKMSWPCVAHIAVRADAQQFNNIPRRAYRVKGLIIQVPANYDPKTREYATSGPGTDNGVWDGTFKMAWTDNPAWCFYDLLVNNRYGLGAWVKPHMVDKWELYEIGRYCDELVPSGQKDANGADLLEPRLTLNCYLQTQEEALRVVQSLASNFRAMTYWASGAVFPAQDRPRDPSYQFNPTNVKGGQFRYSATAARARHNFAIVRYNDPDNHYKPAYEPVLYEKGIRESGGKIYPVDVVDFGGCRRSQAIRKGRWTLVTENEETEVVEMTCGMEGAQLRPGDIFATMDPGRVGEDDCYGRVMDNVGLTVVLDREVTITGDTAHHLIVTTTIGYISEAIITSAPGTTDTVTVDTLAGPIPRYATWMIVTENRLPELWKTLSVSMAGEGEYNISGSYYCPWKFDWVEKDIVVDNRAAWLGGAGLEDQLKPPQGLVLTESLYKDKEDLKCQVQAQWASGSGSTVRYLCSWRRDQDPWVDMPATNAFSATVRDVETPCDLTFAVRAQNLKGDTTPPTTLTLHVLGKQQVPKNVTGFQGKIDDSIIKLTWNVSQELDVPGTEIREGGTSWETATSVAQDVPNGVLVLDIANTRSTIFWAKHRDTWTPPNYSLTAARVDLSIYSPIDGDVLSVAAKRQLALQWTVILAEQTRLDTLANTYGVSHTAFDTAVAAVPNFFSSRTTPYAWTNFTGPTYLGVGGGAQLAQLFNTIKDEQVKLSANIAVANMAYNIASGSTDAMLKSGFVDGITGKIKWDKLQMAVQTIFASQLYLANWDNLVPNPMSEQPAPSGGWPSGTFEGAGVTYGNASDGSYSRAIPPGSTLVLTGQIPCGAGDQFAFRAKIKGTGAYCSIKYNGSTAASSTGAGSSYADKECATTSGAPGGTTYVEFVLVNPGVSWAYADNLYARRMNDALLMVDGCIKAQHLEAVLTITGEIKSPNYVAGTSVAAGQGFRISGPGFYATPLGGSSTLVQAEFGRPTMMAGFLLGDAMDRLWNAMNRVQNGTIAGTNDINPWSISASYQGWVEGVDTLGGMPLGYIRQAQNGFPVSYQSSGFEGSIRVLAKKGSVSSYSANSFSQSLVLPKPAPHLGAQLTLRAGMILAEGSSDYGTGQVGVYLESPSGGNYYVGTVNVSYSGSAVNILSGSSFPALSWSLGSWDVTAIINAGGAGTWRLSVSTLCDARPASTTGSVFALFVDQISLVV